MVVMWVVKKGKNNVVILDGDILKKCAGNVGGYSYEEGDYIDAGGHTVTIVGWDDNFTASKGIFNIKGAWLCKNSWGAQWGDNGYFWLPYTDPTIDGMLGLSVTVNDDCICRYTYTGFPYLSDSATAVKTTAKRFYTVSTTYA